MVRKNINEFVFIWEKYVFLQFLQKIIRNSFPVLMYYGSFSSLKDDIYLNRQKIMDYTL